MIKSFPVTMRSVATSRPPSFPRPGWFGAGLHPTLPTAGESGVEVAGDVSVRRLGDVGIKLRAEPGGGMAEAVLDDPRVLAGVDQEAGRDMAEAVEGQLVGEPGAGDGRVEHPGREGAPQGAALRAGEDQVVPGRPPIGTGSGAAPARRRERRAG